MFHRLLGSLSILLGILWIYKPQWLQGWFVRKTDRKVFWLFLGVILYFFFHYGLALLKQESRLFSQLAALVVGLIIVAIWILQLRIRKKMGSLVGSIPLVCFQAIGILNILTGVALLLSKK